jgi:hypothetical protein
MNALLFEGWFNLAISQAVYTLRANVKDLAGH